MPDQPASDDQTDSETLTPPGSPVKTARCRCYAPDCRRRLTDRRLQPREVLAMVKRSALRAGLPPALCCHSFRATGITAYLMNGGQLEHAREIAVHGSPRTTMLYNRTGDAMSLDEIERIVI